MISSMISWGSESMTREELVVSGYWGESDWANPCGVKIVGFYSLSVRAPSDGGDSGLDTHGGVGETVASVPFDQHLFFLIPKFRLYIYKRGWTESKITACILHSYVRKHAQTRHESGSGVIAGVLVA